MTNAIFTQWKPAIKRIKDQIDNTHLNNGHKGALYGEARQVTHKQLKKETRFSRIKMPLKRAAKWLKGGV